MPDRIKTVAIKFIPLRNFCVVPNLDLAIKKSSTMQKSEDNEKLAAI